MEKINKAKKYINDPTKILLFMLSKGLFSFLPDKTYLSFSYWVRMKKKLDLDDPRTLNEKLQWLKLHDRNPKYAELVDKYAVRDHVKKLIGEEYLIPLLGVWDDPDKIDFEKLPDRFVLKCTHNSGKGMCICRDKSKLNIKKVKRELAKGLKEDYYKLNREWPYSKVTPKIIAEQYMTDESGIELKDYKIFCFNGKPEYVEVDFNRHIEHKLNPYDFDWNPLNFCDDSKNDYNADIKKPKRLEDMYHIAQELSKDMDFLRVDFYSVEDKIYVGELTLFPGSGFINFDPPEIDLKYGKLLRLTKNNSIKEL